MVDEKGILLYYFDALKLLGAAKNTIFFSVILILANLYLMGIVMLFLPSYGHPNPIAFKPPPNQIVNASKSLPNEVTIAFTERPEIGASSIKVMDLNNERVDKNDLKFAGSDKALSVSLNKSKMTFGSYTITWLILSKDDGFISKGSYVFSVGADDGRYQQ
jgi:methionine-rich copper-binding protein CopC